MAWIKIDHETPDKPEVHSMAADLNIDPDTVFGKLIRVWIWADQQSVNGHADCVTSVLIDRVSYQPGFADALLKVGWLKLKKTGAEFPNFDRHNGETAKKRALDSKRKKANREARSEKCPPASVTKRGPEKEKSKIREDNKIGKKKQSSRFVPPSLLEVTEYCKEKGYTFDPESFHAFYESKGWKVGSSKMKSWQSACVTWQKRQPGTSGQDATEAAILQATYDQAQKDLAEGKLI